MREALDRTLRLVRDHIGDVATNADIVDALTDTTVILAGDRANLESAAPQQALMTAMLLTARNGAHTFIDAPNVPIVGGRAPFTRDRLVEAVLDLGVDLIPGVHCEAGRPRAYADLAIVIGDTPWRGRAHRMLRLAGNAWTGRVSNAGAGERWTPVDSPFGALAAAGIAAGEAYKAAMARLRPAARHLGAFDDLFAPTHEADVSLAPAGTPLPSPQLGRFDVVSGGAITQALLYVLARIPNVTGEGRIIEPDASDLSNLTRYSLLRRSHCGTRKVDQLMQLDLGALRLAGLPVRYEEATLGTIVPLGDTVLVGVDHIPTRWLAQQARPKWLGVGATSHYSAMASYHERGTACAHCLHPYDDPDGEPIPTTACVSFWAGLWLASLAVRHAGGEQLSRTAQSVYMTPLRAEAAAATWHAPVPSRARCLVGCPL